jgi:hypothetical protein
MKRKGGIIHDELEGTGKDANEAYFVYLNGLRKTTEYLNQDSKCPGRDSNCVTVPTNATGLKRDNY